MSRTIRRAGVSIAVAATLVLSATGTAVAEQHVTTDDPTEAAAGWLVTQLADGQRLTLESGGETFDNHGPTVDAALALAGVGVGAEHLTAITEWFDDPAQVSAYTGDGTDTVWAGATGKLLLLAAATGEDPTSFGGRDLLSQLTGRRQADGRFTDASEYGDFSSNLTQAYAVLGLHRSAPAELEADDTEFLLEQQCPDGSFPHLPAEDECVGHVDTTGLVVQAFTAVGGDDLQTAAAGAVDWLADHQGSEGGFGGGDEPANANSTGIAAASLALAGELDAAEDARAWLVARQHGCDDEQPGAIRHTVDDDGNLDMATSQALWGLAGIDLGVVSASDATEGVATLACGDEPADQDGDVAEPDEDAADPDEADPDEAVADPDEAGEPDQEAGSEEPVEVGDEEPREGTEAEDGELPRTGLDAGALLVAAIVALALGGALLSRGRRAGTAS